MQQCFFHSSSPMKELLERAKRYAQADWPILILGETGVGKEVLARFIHQQSLRSRDTFIAVNCGAIPTGLIESELFGYERGAFSGAHQSYKGLIRAAQNGSLFLDEIGEMDLTTQVKLLRWLDYGEVRAVGSTKTDKINVRVIAATNADVNSPEFFRADLRERLSILKLTIPPLRNRKMDIAVLANHFIQEHKLQCSPSIPALLSTYDWPGNVRQLRNFLIRSALLSDSGELKAALVERMLEEEQWQSVTGKSNHSGSLADIEKQAILDRLVRCGGNRRKTARELGIAKSTLHEKIKRWKNPESDGVGLSLCS